jgi:hypothetical protein
MAQLVRQLRRPVWRKSDRTRLPHHDRVHGPLVIEPDAKSASPRVFAPLRSQTALSPEWHKARAKATFHMSHTARDCYCTMASACSLPGVEVVGAAV